MAQEKEVDSKVDYGRCLNDYLCIYEDKSKNNPDGMSRIIAKTIAEALRVVKETAENNTEYRTDLE